MSAGIEALGRSCDMPAEFLAAGLSARSLDSYIASVLRQPRLDRQTELALAQRLHEHHDLQAATQLVLCNLRHVVHIARGYRGYGLPLADLIQEGNIGLMKAVRRFDPQRGVALIGFAVHWIKAAIHDYVIANWRIVKTATTKAQRKLFFRLRSAKSGTAALTLSQAEALAQQLEVGCEELRRMETRMAHHDLSLDAPCADHEQASSWGEVLPAPQDTAAEVERQQWQAHRLSRLHKALRALDARSRDIVQRRWLCEDQQRCELQQLADEYGVSAERIRQIQNQALLRLRERLGD
ncbi:RNA polymerase sigma factor RpoH [Solimonas aquatica]|nr:RNA polymerase sigma factor RpoH [Solimonas aquatica]